MQLSQKEINDILGIFANRLSLFIGNTMGVEFLTDAEKKSLENMGFDLQKIYESHKDPMYLQHQLGMISELIGLKQANKISSSQFVNDIRRGNYIKLNAFEKQVMNHTKKKALSSIRSFEGRIFSDVNGIISNSESNNRKAYEKVIRKELEWGVANRASKREIVSNLGHKTGDWARNWNRIVATESHNAFDEGRASMIKRRDGENARVYKDVYPGACKHCIRLYLKNGIGSEPIVFLLSEIEANGNNNGRKVADYKAVVGTTHPFCRCTLKHLRNGEKWDEENGVFRIPKDKKFESKLNRPKIEIMVGEQKYEI